MANAIVGTLELLALAGVIGIPVGVLGGVYLAEYGTARVNAVLRFMADVLNGVPSITWGVVVYGLIVLRFKSFSVLRWRTRAGVNHDSIDPAHDRGSRSSCASRLSRSCSRPGHRRWKTIVQIVMKTASQGNHHWHFARARARSAAKPPRFFSLLSATAFGTTALSSRSQRCLCKFSHMQSLRMTTGIARRGPERLFSSQAFSALMYW